MDILPAIDLLEGRVVRLRRGRYDDVTTYAPDPGPVAEGFARAGACWLHVVDLDGARAGRPGNVAPIREVLRRAPGLRVQVGGGIRDEATARTWLDAGVERVILGTAAVRDPSLVERVSAARPGSVAVAVDARGGRVAVEGWTETTAETPAAVARRLADAGAGAVLFTAIERDGTGDGPDVEATAALQRQVQVPVIASGGVGSLDHLRGLARAGIRAAIVGRALYEGQVDLAEALAVAGAAGEEA